MISVCMATYNGERYIREQIDSILCQLNSEDELIISDDGSMDGTLEIVKEYIDTDKRIKLLSGPGKGVIANFENAIMQAKGEYIYLSDQDDVWVENKCHVVQKAFDETGALVIVHDAIVVDKDKNVVIPSFYVWRNSAPGFIHNLWRNSYIGCCMAFRRDLITSFLPIPKDIAMHDQWLGMCGELKRKTFFVPDKLLLYRRHGDNVSSLKHGFVIKMISQRIRLVIRLFLRSMKIA